MYQKQQKLYPLQRLLRIIVALLPWKGILSGLQNQVAEEMLHIRIMLHLLSATNMAMADSPDETDPSKILSVQLPSGSVRTELNLKDHPENLGKKIQITGIIRKPIFLYQD